MLIHDNIYFHGCAELITSPYRSGLQLQRVPEAVRQQLDIPAQRVIQHPNGMELRFVPLHPSRPTEVILSSKHPTRVFLNRGDFRSGNNQSFLIDGTPRAIPVAGSPHLGEYMDRLDRSSAFSPEVVRVRFAGLDGPVYYHGVEEPVRPPRPEEMPAETLLAYGTSITAGSHATVPDFHGFPPRLARALGCDLLNYGCPGAAYIEPALVDYMATRTFTRATLCVSVNMIASFSVETFAERAEYLVRRLSEAQPEAEIAAISILPYFGQFIEERHRKDEAFRQALRDIVARIGSQHVRYVHGPDLLDELDQLTDDLIHPADDGFATIASRLLKHFHPTA